MKKTCLKCILTPLAPLVTGPSLIGNHSVIQYDSIWVTEMYLLDQVSDSHNISLWRWSLIIAQSHSLCQNQTSQLIDNFSWFYNLSANSGEVLMYPATKEHVNCDHCHVLRYTPDCLKLSHSEWLNALSLSLSLSLSLVFTPCDICIYCLWHLYFPFVTFFYTVCDICIYFLQRQFLVACTRLLTWCLVVG